MSSQAKLLMTGVTGYIGFQTLTIALERGYSVCAIVRRQRDVVSLRTKSPLIATREDQGRLAFAIIPNLLDTGAILQHLDGITAIIHLASPLGSQEADYERTVIAPAVDMVTVILEAAAQVASVQRVIITSSCVTLVPFEWNSAPDSERLYTVEDINSSPTKPYGSPMEAYWASKALARIATRNFARNKKPHFEIVNILPSVVIGPDTRVAVDGKPEELLVGARGAVMASALHSSLNSAFPYVGVPVHVRDVAKAHVNAADRELIPGVVEYLISSDGPDGVVWDRDTVAIATKYFPREVENRILPLEGSLPTVKWRLDAIKTEQAFGWKMTSFDQTMRELLAQYVQLKLKRANQ